MICTYHTILLEKKVNISFGIKIIIMKMKRDMHGIMVEYSKKMIYFHSKRLSLKELNVMFIQIMKNIHLRNMG